MSTRGFTVTRNYLGLETAWRAEFKRGAQGQGRVVGVNAEMDALPGIGHACGHNLIAMAGVGIALALRAALEKHDVSGTVILLGTPGAWSAVLPGSSMYRQRVRALLASTALQPRNMAPESRSY
jgi:metal-dependent amidase/aminoacylase/carboxypeptidase family protein